mmetsp:Transcript_6204/g.9877  ORF Transcript_6204/g.9877 Transcript_6204/m.9877 type:complete len:265 (-) Transcript_6204:69-863(-)
MWLSHRDRWAMTESLPRHLHSARVPRSEILLCDKSRSVMVRLSRSPTTSRRTFSSSRTFSLRISCVSVSVRGSCCERHSASASFMPKMERSYFMPTFRLPNVIESEYRLGRASNKNARSACEANWRILSLKTSSLLVESSLFSAVCACSLPSKFSSASSTVFSKKSCFHECPWSLGTHVWNRSAAHRFQYTSLSISGAETLSGKSVCISSASLSLYFSGTPAKVGLWRKWRAAARKHRSESGRTNSRGAISCSTLPKRAVWILP